MGSRLRLRSRVLEARRAALLPGPGRAYPAGRRALGAQGLLLIFHPRRPIRARLSCNSMLRPRTVPMTRHFAPGRNGGGMAGGWPRARGAPRGRDRAADGRKASSLPRPSPAGAPRPACGLRPPPGFEPSEPSSEAAGRSGDQGGTRRTDRASPQARGVRTRRPASCRCLKNSVPPFLGCKRNICYF